MRRFWAAFRDAFWTAFYQTAARHVPKNTIVFAVAVDTAEAHVKMAALESHIDVLTQKADYLAVVAGRLH